MKKLRIVGLAVAIVVAVAVSALASYLDITGFRDFKWGMTPKEMGCAYKIEAAGKGVVYYHKFDDTLKYAGRTVNSIKYGFYKNRLFFVELEFGGGKDGLATYNRFYDSLSKDLGQPNGSPITPTATSNGMAYWKKPSGNAILSYSPEWGVLTIRDTAIRNEMTRDLGKN